MRDQFIDQLWIILDKNNIIHINQKWTYFNIMIINK